MGGMFGCMRKSNSKFSCDNVQMDFESTTSITNLSQLSCPVTISRITASSSILTPNTKFSWGRLQSIYRNMVESGSKQEGITSETLVVMKSIFGIIENNIGSMSHSFYECLLEMDRSFPGNFEECAGRNPKSATTGKILIDRIKNHTLTMMHIHSVIVDYLQKPHNEEAYNIMRLIAVSHALMKVLPQHFIFMNMVMGNFLLKCDFLNETNAENIVCYFNFVTNTITNYMKVQIKHDLTIHNLNTARENYRKMKKWYAFVDNLRKETNQLKDVESSIKTPTIPTELSDQSTVPTEVLKPNACLMKYFVKKKNNQ